MAPSYDDICNFYYLHEKKLGEGGFAKVRLATHLATSQLVAVKVLDKLKLGPELPRVYNEIQCLKKLKHQNIARLYQVFETQTVIYLVLEYCAGGELFDYIVSKSRLEESEAAQIIYELMRVLDFIHINGFAHRDLKPENVLFDDKQHIKLIDFGLSANCSADNMALTRTQAPLDQLTTCCGSVTYAAPEVIGGGIYSGTSIDVWSAGVMMYALVVGRLPFNDDNIPKLYQKIQGGLKSLPDHLSPEACDLIKKMLTVDPKHRITVRDVLSHPWLRNRTNTHARINRRLDFNNGLLDEQLLERCHEKFPHLSLNQLREYIIRDFNYYSTTYHLLQSKCPPRTIGIKRTPERPKITQNKQGTPIRMPPSHGVKRRSPDKIAQLATTAHGSPIKKSRFVTVCNTPKTPKTPPSYLRRLHEIQTPIHNGSPFITPSKNRQILTPSRRHGNQENNNKMAAFIYRLTPRKSIVKRLLRSATPSRKRKALSRKELI